MSNWIRRIFVGMVVSAVFVMSLTGAVMGASPPATLLAANLLPGKVTALPNPPAYPEHDVFLVTLVHAPKVPVVAVIHFVSATGQRSTSTNAFKKVNRYQYETVWSATSSGHVQFLAYAARHQLVAEASYPVRKGHANVAGRVFIGALFIGGSLWFWWRQQRFSRSR